MDLRNNHIVQLPSIPFDDWLAHVVDSTDEELVSLGDFPCAVWDRLWALRVAAQEPLPVSVRSLERLHDRLKGKAFESDVWAELVAKAGFAIPEAIAHELLDRKIAVSAVFRSTPTMSVLRRVSMADSQAAWRLACTLCFSDRHSPDEFGAFLRAHAHHVEMLRSLARLDSVPGPKEEAMMSVIRSHPDAAELLRSRRVKLAAGAAARARNDEEIERLYRSHNPHVLRELAANPLTPIPLLRELLTRSGSKFARQIRVLAAQNLARRDGEVRT